jgi:RNA polymerase sigma factor (sigma-70 family)
MQTTLQFSTPLQELIEFAQMRLEGSRDRRCERAFSTLYGTFVPELIRVTRNRLTGIDFAAIEEACADLFQSALQKFPLRSIEGDIDTAFRKWIFKTVRWIGDKLRAEVNWNNRTSPYDPTVDPSTEFVVNEEEEQEILAIEHEAVREFMPTLPEEKRQVLTMRANGHKWQDIAQSLDAKTNRIKMQVYRLRAAMNEHIRAVIRSTEDAHEGQITNREIPQPIKEDSMTHPLPSHTSYRQRISVSPFQRLMIQNFDPEYWQREVNRRRQAFNRASIRVRLRLFCLLFLGTAIGVPVAATAQVNQSGTGSGSCIGWMCGNISSVAASPLVSGGGAGAQDMISAPFWMAQLIALVILCAITLVGMLAAGQGREWMGAFAGFSVAIMFLLISNYLGAWVVGAASQGTAGNTGGAAPSGQI